MERKSIGSFIAALRKANGMTQKDLAGRLNVSDKSVSRWERDDGTPDLALIPVIAEIFGVTCDELLRGERRPAVEREMDAAASAEKSTPRGEKQRHRLLSVGLSKYKTRTFIAIGVAATGLIAAMVGNFGFLRAYIGFLVGTIFYLVSAVCQAVFVNDAFLSVSDDFLAGEEIGRFKWSVIRLAEWSIGLTAVLLGFSLPLIIFTGDAYVGLSAGSWFLHGLLFAALALLVVAIVCYYLNASLLKKGSCTLCEKEKRIYGQNHTLKRKCVIGLVVALAVTLVVHAFGSEVLWSTQNMAAGTTFHDYESFAAYMEQDIPYEMADRHNQSGWFTTAEECPAAPESSVQEIPADDVTWFDENGNEINGEEALTRTLEDKNGNVVCTYIDRNQSVSSIRYSPKDGTVLPITVITNEDYRIARDRSELITMAYCLLYPVELFAAVMVYIRKRVK